MRRWVNYTKATGSTTQVLSGHLIDEYAAFVSGVHRIRVGDVVENETTGEQAVVTKVHSETDLGLSQDIFVNVGDRYRIRAGFQECVGTTSDVAEGKLIDANATFISSGIRADFTVKVYDPDTGEEDVATVVSVDSETQLSLSKDIAAKVGLKYRVYPGEFVFSETLEEIERRTKRLVAADSTEISVTTQTDVKKADFFSSPKGLEVRHITALCELKGNGSAKLLVDGVELDERQVSSDSYSLYVLEGDVDLDVDSKHTVIIQLVPAEGETLWIGLVEIYAQEVEKW